ncbi:hypothetical protein OU994_19435 [Pseudoduganella sp. SL102]|uniref:cupredoxin domain-containing protein n=1 Tax=Pseudoduganella sp. SL102 TaxID=2995154 RepID=UPI00248CDB56|nr:hypothetical protein [Pseudoduganella sp. SL102]WBS00480.1 hypothetical protein OU994_19435 [Pseudoduganella sp. SL102]
MRPLRPLWLAFAVAAAISAWSAFAPLPDESRDELFEIPKGTWARRMAGDKVDILPDTITLTVGVKDVLLLRNADTVPQIFGPVLIMPGQDFRLPFDTVSVNEFNCSAHSSGSMKVIVEPHPAAGIARLKWRVRRASRVLPASFH